MGTHDGAKRENRPERALYKRSLQFCVHLFHDLKATLQVSALQYGAAWCAAGRRGRGFRWEGVLLLRQEGHCL